MNNYCKHLKRRKGNPYCKILNKEIILSECKNCTNKEYKTKNMQNSFYGKLNKNKKSTKLLKNSVFNVKKSPKNTKIVQKSKKIAKLERNRYSVFTDNLDICYLCGKPKEHLHEIFFGSNRLNSIKYGFVIPVCNECHRKCHSDSHIQEFWHKRGQIYWESNIGSRNEFIAIFRRNYLD